MRYAVLAILAVALAFGNRGQLSADPIPCRDETRKIAALKDRIASLERTLEAERLDKIDTNYKYIIASLALNKSEAIVASLKVENTRLKAANLMTQNATSRSVPPMPAKLIPPSSKPPHTKRMSSKRYKPKTIARKSEPNHSGGLITWFW